MRWGVIVIVALVGIVALAAFLVWRDRPAVEPADIGVELNLPQEPALPPATPMPDPAPLPLPSPEPR